MLALTLPALASAATCSQATCCVAITGMCSGNDGGTGDIVCAANTVAIAASAATAAGATAQATCCEATCSGYTTDCTAGDHPAAGTVVGNDDATCCIADVVDQCTGNTVSGIAGATAAQADVVCATGFTAKAGGGNFANGADAAAQQTACCDADAAVCAAYVTDCTAGDHPAADTVVGNDDATCCIPDVVDKCTGNTVSGIAGATAAQADVVCAALTTAKAGTPGFANGADAAAQQTACCDDITGKCTGNTGGTGDVACPATDINKGATVDGTDAAGCCETACVATLCAAATLQTKAAFATIVGTTTAACCDAADVAGMCHTNTLAASNFDCSATSTDIAVDVACTPAVTATTQTSGAATATVAASALALVAALL